MAVIKESSAMVRVGFVLLTLLFSLNANGLSTRRDGAEDFQYGEMLNTTANSKGLFLSQYSELDENWVKMPFEEPYADGFCRMAYNRALGEFVLFGGDNDDYNNITWIYNLTLNKWNKMNCSNNPVGRWGHAMAYDEKNDKIILFGASEY